MSARDLLALLPDGETKRQFIRVYDPVAKRFSNFELPATGALVRHMAIDERSGDVWLAYGASPGIPARVARLRAVR